MPHSFESSAAGDSGEARTGSAEATSLFTGSPSRASLVEGDILAEFNDATDLTRLHDENVVASACLSAVYPSESLSVFIIIPFFCVSPHMVCVLTVLTILMTIMGLLNRRCKGLLSSLA